MNPLLSMRYSEIKCFSVYLQLGSSPILEPTLSCNDKTFLLPGNKEWEHGSIQPNSSKLTTPFQMIGSSQFDRSNTVLWNQPQSESICTVQKCHLSSGCNSRWRKLTSVDALLIMM